MMLKFGGEASVFGLTLRCGWRGAAIGKPQAVISEEALAEKNANRTGGDIANPSARVGDAIPEEGTCMLKVLQKHIKSQNLQGKIRRCN